MDIQRTVVVAPRPDKVWAGIVTHAATPETIACVISAEALPGGRARVAEYTRLRDAKTFVPLNRLTIPASYLAELGVIVGSRDTGIPASRLDANARTFLADRGLIRAVPPSRHEPRDWRSTVAATVPGKAVVRAYTGKMPRLRMSEALPLAVIERDMGGEDGGSRLWPGSDLLLRMAQVWRLTEYVRRPGGFAVYRLSDSGRRELDRAREGGGGAARMGSRDVALLEEVDRCNGDLGELTLPRKRAVTRAVEAGWLRVGATVPGTGRRYLSVTKGGRAAIAAETAPADTAKPDPEPNRKLTDLQPGMWVRLSNRRGSDVGPGWVRVVEVRNPSDMALRNNYELWVETDGRPEPFLYGGRPLYHLTRFERRPE